mmetsp:Transcript_4588/g.9255  ORF Transcript_4588/g.9255 Transcript_4588/m.9255 type:complete len:228 (-) Transcript_4588:798-1481(-)
MTVMIKRIILVRVHGAQVLQMNFAQTTLQLFGHAQINGKAISGKFVDARNHSQDKGQNLIDGCPNGLEKQEQCNNNGCGPARIVESKGSIQIFRLVHERKDIKCGTKVCLRRGKVGKRMTQLPMSQLVSQNGQNFVFFHLLHERIEQYDAFVISETKHECIRMGGSFGAIHDKQFGEGIFERACQFVNTSFQRAIFQRFILVEQGHDKDRDNRHHKDRKNKHESPNI